MMDYDEVRAEFYMGWQRASKGARTHPALARLGS